MISNPIPRSGQEGKRFLKENFDVTFFEVPAEISQEERISRVAQICQQIGSDVITNVFGGGTSWGHVASVVSRALGCKGVARVSGDEITSFLMQGDFERNSPVHRYKTALERESFALASSVIVMSPWEQRRVQALLEGKDKEKVKVCMRGVNFENFPYREPKRKQLKKFSYIGRKSEEKGYFLLEETSNQLAAPCPALQFMFAGNFEPGRTGNKVFTGYIDSAHLNNYYNTIDALVLPSLTEGMPQVVCEAMAKGRPVIVSRHLFQGYLNHGEHAMLVDLNVKDISRKILMLHTDEDLAYSISVNSRNFALENFDKRHWEKVYRKIILT
jgi:glycosyltransferase involved in cell wall biosynthesis